MDTTGPTEAVRRNRRIKWEAWITCKILGLPFEPRRTGSAMTKGFKPIALLSHIPLDFIRRIELRTKHAGEVLPQEGTDAWNAQPPVYIIMPPEDFLEDGEDGPLEHCFRAGYRSVAGTKDQYIAFACAEDAWRVEAVYIKVWTLTDTGVEPKPSRLPSKSEVDEIVNYWPADNEAKLYKWRFHLHERRVLDARVDRDRDRDHDHDLDSERERDPAPRIKPCKIIMLRLPPVKLLGLLLCAENRKAGPKFKPRTVGELYPRREGTSTVPRPATTGFVVPPLGPITYSSSQSVSAQAVPSSPTFQSAAMDVLRSSEALNAFNDALLAGRLNLHHNLVKYIHDRSAKARSL